MSKSNIKGKTKAGKDSRPGYKHTPLGWIPENWVIKELGQIAKVTSGGTPDRKTPEYWTGNIPWITTSLIDFNAISEVDEYITDEGLLNSAAKKYNPGTLLMAMYGQGKTRGKVAKLNIVATTNQACAAIVVENGVSIEYLFQYLWFNYQNIRNLSNTGSQENLNLELIKSIKIKLPPNKIQNKIALILSTWDEAINKTQQLIEQLNRRNKGLMQELLFSKLFDSTISLRDCFSPHKEQLPNNGQFPLYSLTIEAGVSPKSDRYEREFLVKDKEIKKYAVVNPGDLVFNPANLRWGAIAIHNLNHKVLVSPIYEVLTFKNKTISSQFLGHLLTSEKMIRFYASKTEGTLVERMAVKLDTFLAIKVNYPKSKTEQNKISKIISDSQLEIKITENKLAQLLQQKKGLMQKLLTGEIRTIN